MRKIPLTILVFVFAVFIATGAQAAIHTELHKAASTMEKLVFQPIEKWQMSSSVTKAEALSPKGDKEKYRKVGIGYFWADEREIWLRSLYKVPETILNIPVEGSRIALSANVEDYGEIYVNGELAQIFRRSTGYVVLTEKAEPGKYYFIVIMARRKPDDAGLIRNISLEYEVLEDLELKVTGYTEAFEALETLFALTNEKPEDWEDLLNEAGKTIDIEAMKAGDTEKFYASLDKSNEILAPLTEKFKQFNMLLMAYSHIDLAWMWDRDEGENVVWKGTSEKVLDLEKSYPGFVYICNQMHGYRWMEKDYPELFERIKEAVAKGVWDPTGAEWAEPDGNLPHGESYVRQFMYGRKYSIKHFGFASTLGLTPDSFGYNWNMPQILKKCDMRAFMTQKISWNDTTHFPHNLFWWEAPDGTRLLTFFPKGSYAETVDGLTMAVELKEINEKHGVDSNYVMWGIGDHGGGIPRDYARRAFGLKTSPIYPNIKFINGEELIEWALDQQEKTEEFPVWDDELYLEYHRGTYTSQANTKNNNRRNEQCLMNAEVFSSIAEMTKNVEYPFDQLEEAWKILLFNQFHDILPGSSIPPVYDDADSDYAWIAGECADAMKKTMPEIAADADTSTGPGEPIVVFNNLSWQRDDIVEYPLPDGMSDASVFTPDGEAVPSQIVDGKDGKAVIFVARAVPAMGFSVYRVAPAAGIQEGRPLKVEGNVIENEFFKVTVDKETGWVTSIYDIKNGVEAIEPGKTAFELSARKETEKADAWDPRFPDDGGHMEMLSPTEVKIVENGPVRATIMVTRKFGEKSELRQYYSLVEGKAIVYGRLDADWLDRSVFLKSAFNYNLDSDFATYEIPYAAITRTTKPETPAEKAQWEVSGHRWVDYSDADKKYGVSLLSFSKYGYDANDNVIRMSMLRAPNHPDPEADLGHHSIPYALYPHSGSWQDADTPLRGREYNAPLIALPAKNHSGTLGTSHGYFAASPSNVVIPTIKKAESGEGYIIRLVETEGTDSEVTIDLPATPKKVVETNLVERDLEEITAPGSARLKVPIGHYEIKTLRVVF